jgi:AraC-like DNA-binding protein
VRSCHVEELAAGATDCYLAGPRFLHFCKNPSLWGVVIWSRPSEDDVVPLSRSLPLELSAPAEPHGSIVDASRLSGVDSHAFGLLGGYVRSQFEALSRMVVRLALVRPVGVEGAVVAGFFEVLPRPYPVRVFENAAEGFEWLAEDPRVRVPPGMVDELEDIYVDASATNPLVSALGAYLELHLESPNITDAAKALATSERTLQRRLKQAKTSFHNEVQRARMRVAERLLLDTDAPLTRIAFDVGCASLQHFSALFRKQCGESPSAWRARRRGS